MRHYQILRRRADAHPPGRVVMGAVTGAEPAVEIALKGQRNTTQMCAHPNQDQPFRPLAAIGVGGRRVLWKIFVARYRIDELVERDGRGFLDLLRRTAADEDRLAAPHHGDRLARLNCRNVHFDRREREHGSGRIHLIDKRPSREGKPYGADGACGDVEKITPRRFGRLRIGHGYTLFQIPAVRRLVESLGLSEHTRETPGKRRAPPPDLPVRPEIARNIVSRL